MLRPFNDGVLDRYVKVRTRRKADFQFANVDLELESFVDLQPLIDEFGNKARALYHQGLISNFDKACIEICEYQLQEKWIYHSFDEKVDLIGGADILISAFCDLIENLSSTSRAIWDQCTRREFDVGYTCGNTEKSYQTKIQATTLQRCAALEANILFTVYPYINYELRAKEGV